MCPARIRRRRLQSALYERLERLALWLLPGYCFFCLAPSVAGEPWCRACWRTLPFHLHGCPRCAEPLPERVAAGTLCGRCLQSPPAFDEAIAPFLYRGQIARLVQRFKYQHDRRAAGVLLRLYAKALADDKAERTQRSAAMPEALVVASLHESRARERGFDQSLWLGQALAGRLGLPLFEATRTRRPGAQHRLGRAARRANVRGSYRLEKPLPACVLLLDDVMTTGATLDALAHACRCAGAARCIATAAARTPAERPI